MAPASGKVAFMDRTEFERLAVVSIGEHRGRPRLYLQGKWLLAGGFTPGAGVQATFERGRVVLEVADGASRRVSSKADGAIGVIDINSEELRASLAEADEVQLHATHGQILITPSRTAAKVAARVRNGLEGSVFAGGGLLTQAAREAGLRPAFAVELDPRYAEVYEANHAEATMYCMSVHEVPVERLPQVETLTIGIPCEPFSVKRRQAGARALPPEAHEHGDLVVWALRIVDRCNPWSVVIEEVPAFLDSGAGWILQHALRRMGYNVEARVLDSADHGALTMRKRAVIVATTDATITWPVVQPRTRQLAEVLDAAVPAESWFDATSKSWIFDHWQTQAAKGNNFGNQKFDATSGHVGALSKRYFSIPGDAPVLRHPTLPDTYRLFTIDEVKRLHGLPASYKLPVAKTTAGEVLCQGVVVSTFRQVLEQLRAQPVAAPRRRRQVQQLALVSA